MLTRARYVTICQQVLVTAATVAVGLSAAGVMTLQIVSPEQRDADASAMAPAIDVTDGYAATEAVTPRVREIKVAPVKPEKKAPVATKASPAKAAKKLAAVSEPAPVHGYATVGVTWKPGTDLAEDDIAVQVRTQKDGVWSQWQTAEYHDEHGPDAGTAEAARATRPGTDAVVVGNVDQVQMRAETADGVAPADLELAVVDPGASAVTKQPAAIDTARLPAANRDDITAAPIESTPDAGSAAALGDGAAADLDPVAMKTAPKPVIYSRAQWGANENLRDKKSLHYGTVKAGFIHHTVNANNYTAEQVPALLRGIYAYHTQSRGWSDIGYNYLVDRFGRIWEGRYGGVDRAVVGAHTLGYNEYAFAMSAIGNFDVAQPPQAVLDAYAKLFAWKLSLYDIRADAPKLYVKNRYLPAINGHRDVGKTACPGKYLYAKIGSIRTAAQVIQNKAQVPADPVNQAPVPPPAGLVLPVTEPAAARTQPSFPRPVRAPSLGGSAWPDLVVRSASGVISVVPTEGVLGYGARIYSRGNWSAMGIIAAAGDLNGDGRSDVIAKNKRTGVARVHLGDGTGRVSRAGIRPTTAFASVRAIYAARDFNRDGKNDVLGWQRTSKSLLLFRGDGKGGFAAPVVLHRRWTLGRVAPVGDMNGDRQPDLVVASGLRGLYLVPGARRGSALGKAVRLATARADISSVLGWGDLNGDRRTDVLVRESGSGLGALYSGTGGKGLGQVYGSFTALQGLGTLSMAPMVGPSAADVVGRDSAGRLVVVPSNGRRNLGSPLPSNLRVTNATQVLNVGDWNRDGHADVIVRINEGRVLILYPGLGNGKFGRPLSFGGAWRTVSQLAAVGDVTGDGFPDLMGRIGTGPMTIFPGNGSKAYKAPVLAPASLRTFNQIGSAPWSPRGAAFVSADGSFVPLTGSATGAALRAANGSAQTAYDTYLGVGDADGDGVADVLAREKGSGTLWLLPGKTSGGFAPRVWVASGFGAYTLLG